MTNNIFSKFFLLALILYPISPKIGFDGFYLYPSDLIILFLFSLSIFFKKNNTFFKDIIILNIYLILAIFSTFIFFDSIERFHFTYLKQLFFLTITIYIIDFIQFNDYEKIIKLILYSWAFIIFLNLSYIILYYVINNPTEFDSLFRYESKYRLTGLTGSGYNLITNEFFSPFTGNELGTTTVPLSILLSLLFFISLSSKNNLTYLILLLIFLIGTIFTMSRSGILVILIGICTLFFIKGAMNPLIKLLVILFLLLICFLLFEPSFLFGLEKLNFTQTSKFITVSLRQDLWLDAINFLFSNPLSALFGIHITGFNVSDVIGIDYAESLFFDLFLHFGLFGIIYFGYLFYSLFYKINNLENFISSYHLNIGLKIFFPGFLLANFFSGSPIFADFIFSIFFFFIYISRKQ